MKIAACRFGSLVFGLLLARTTEATMKKQDELVVITKRCDLILWSCNHTGRFPRRHRFVLGEHLERSLDDLLETLIQVKYSLERTPLLNDANLKDANLKLEQACDYH